MFFCTNFNVSLTQINNKNCLSNEGILSILEESAERHSASIGYGVINTKNTNLTWALLNWKVKVFTSPKYGTKLFVKTWARYKNRFYTYRDYEVYDEDENLLIIATSKWILIDINKQSVISIEDEFYEKYLPENKSVFNILELPKLKEPQNSTETYIYTVKRNDIDVNGHMHNINYLILAYEALPENIYENNEFDNFEILYKKEVKYGNKIKCFYNFDNNVHTITIKSDDLATLHAIIKLY